MKFKALVSVFPILSLFLLFQSISSIGAQEYSGNVDWQNRIIRATGYGAPNPNVPRGARRAGALRAARNDALRTILEIVKGMNLTSETTVRNFMTENDVIRTRVEGVVRNFKIVDIRYMSSGDVEVDVEMPVTGILSESLLTDEMFSDRKSLFDVAASDRTYTGLIVDSRGLGVRPAMAPKILNEDGKEIYGTGYVSRDYAISMGIVGYVKDLDDAVKNERVADNPLIVKGLKSTGTNRTDVVISNEDAALIHSIAKNLNFLDQCKVIFLVD